MKSKHKKWILIGALVAVFNPISLLLLIVGVGLWSNAHPHTGETAAHVAWLPAEASRVSYYKTYSWTAYEFDIAEPEFRKWASHWTVVEVTNPVTIMRYTFGTSPHPAYDPELGSRYAEYRASVSKTVTNGLFYRTPERSNGGGTTVAYDRSIGRAYYQANPR